MGDRAGKTGMTDAEKAAALLAGKRFMRENWWRRPTHEEVAAAAGVSPDQFRKLFRREVGVTLKYFMTRIQVDEAKRLLSEEPKASLEDVAARLGFYNGSHLTARFKQFTGQTPSEYRRRRPAR